MSDTSLPHASLLLTWYDRHARDLPWRVPPALSAAGHRPDPYRIWLSEVMLQQTTVAAVKSYFHLFTTNWPTVADLAGARDEDVMAAWAGLGYYARARNLLKCARQVVQEFGGVFPQSEAALLSLPGIGPYTAAAIASIAFGSRAVVVDGNVERVVSRLFDIQDPLPLSRPQVAEKAALLTPAERAGDYAQAVMDLGSSICTPKNPACAICPFLGVCLAQERGTAADLPNKIKKKAKPTHRGMAYVVRNSEGAYLLERRPERGLLGGMLGWPTTQWSADPEPAPPVAARWQRLPEIAKHTFTHFHLELEVFVAEVPQGANPERGVFDPAFNPEALPTVMRKVWELAARHWREA